MAASSASSAVAAPPRVRSPWIEFLAGQLLALAGAFLFAGLVGAAIIRAYGVDPLEVYRIIWVYGTSEVSDVARVFANATPLIFSGLAVAVAFKAGLFNIGVEGQYIVAMMAAAAAAVSLDALPGVILLPVVIVAAMLAGVVWAAIPGVLKVKTGAHEVVTTIMMNGIAVSLVAWALLNPLRSADEGLVDLRTDIFTPKALVPRLSAALGLEDQIPGSVHLTWLFPVALLACVIVWFLLFRTRLGYEIRAIGSSGGSAEAGGISIQALQVKAFVISGALAGLVGLNGLLGDRGYLAHNYEIGLGFAGITVAFLGRNHPVGIALAGTLLGLLARGQDGIAVSFELPTETLIILEGILILSVVVAYELVRRGIARRRQRAVRAEEKSLETAAKAGEHAAS
ncbi:MAG: ABC transporter permease [Actinomycetota bacterium]|nr:ABC transporter permease [Actinomycetota bacterium]